MAKSGIRTGATVWRVSMKDLKKNIHSGLKLAAKNLQDDWVRGVKSHPRAYKAPTHRGPLKTTFSQSTGNFSVEMGIKVGSKAKYYPVFVEFGTGEYMHKSWSISRTETAVNSGGRSIPRKNKKIYPRGKGSKWTNYNGEVRSGWNELIFYWKKKNRWVRTFSVRGQPGQYRLNEISKDFFDDGSKLKHFCFKLYDSALKLAPLKIMYQRKVK